MYSVVKQVRFNVDGDETSLYTVETASFPTTRYQGSKKQIIDWLWSKLETIEFDSLLDAFGGTGVVSHRAKQQQKRVVYNDYLPYNYHVGKSLIENADQKLTEEDIDFLCTRRETVEYPSVIQDEFKGRYYTEKENKWLDVVRRNIKDLEGSEYTRCLALAAVGQACLAKRPYNLFHRANLDMRLKDVERTFGNKKTWDRSFESHLKEKAKEFNEAVFDNERENEAYCRDVLLWEEPPETDLVYLDPPYYDSDSGGTDYSFYYHFLNGYVEYDSWRDRIDRTVKTRRLKSDGDNPWLDESSVYEAFETVLDRFSDRHIVISYNSSGLPTTTELKSMLENRKKNVRVYSQSHQYTLSESSSEELLFVATD